MGDTVPGRRSRQRDGQPATQICNYGKAGCQSFPAISSITISVQIFFFHKRSTAKPEGLNIFTNVFRRDGVVIGGISKACSSCSILRHVNPYDILENGIQNQVSGGLLPQIHNLELSLSSC